MTARAPRLPGRTSPARHVDRALATPLLQRAGTSALILPGTDQIARPSVRYQSEDRPMVATAPPKPPAIARPTTYQEPLPPPREEDHSAGWAFLWVLFAFKMATVFLIWWASRSYSTGVFLVATTWFWMVIPALALAAPMAFRWRLIKMRKRRAALQRSEWLLNDSTPAAGPADRLLTGRNKSI